MTTTNQMIAGMPWLANPTGEVVRTGLAREAHLDSLPKAATAFGSWGELMAEMAGGYVPTLNGNGKVRQLALAMRRDGYPVHRDGRTR